MSARRLLGFVFIFDALALAILYPRIDIFSGAYIALSTALAVLQAVVSDRLSGSEQIQRLFYAKDLDRVWDKVVTVLGLAELAVFFEYSHWRPFPHTGIFVIRDTSACSLRGWLSLSSSAVASLVRWLLFGL